MIARLRETLLRPFPALVLPEKRLWPVIIFAYACLLPRELSLDIAGAALFPYRLVLLAIAPLCVATILRHRLRPSIVDLFALLTASWFFIALLNAATLSLALTRGVALTLDFALAYLVGRASIRSSDDVRTVFRFMIPGLVGVAAVLALESVLRQSLLRPGVGTLVGSIPDLYAPEIRLGLGRAMGPFPHPILAGVFMASTLPLAMLATRDLRFRLLAAMASLSAFFSLSAAAFVALMLGIGLLAIYAVQRWIKLPLFALASAYFVLLLIFIEIGSESGVFSFLLRYLTINPASGSYRLLIWEFGWADAMRHPWFGIGDGDWARPSWMPNPSVDSLWLVLPLYYGLPAMIGTGLTLAGAGVAVLHSQKLRSTQAHPIGAALAMMLLMLALAGLTVHLWENLLAWLLMVCGMAVSLATQIHAAARVRATAVQTRGRQKNDGAVPRGGLAST